MSKKTETRIKTITDVRWFKFQPTDMRKLLSFPPDDVCAGLSAAHQYWNGNAVDETAMTNNAWRAFYVVRDALDVALEDLRKKQESGFNSLKNVPPDAPSSIEFVADSKPYRCAVFLDECIRDRLPSKPPATEAQKQEWADAFDKLNRIDGQDWELIAEVLEFSQTDDFWQKNILSGDKFRKQFFALLSKMRD